MHCDNEVTAETDPGVSRESCRLLQQLPDRKAGHGRALASDYFRIPQRLSWACSIKRCIMETDSHPGNPAPSTSDLPAPSVDDPSLSEKVDFTSGSSTPQREQNGVADWFTWEESSLKSSAAYVVKLFGFWLVNSLKIISKLMCLSDVRIYIKGEKSNHSFISHLTLTPRHFWRFYMTPTQSCSNSTKLSLDSSGKRG